jgi:hypothetical protein
MRIVALITWLVTAFGGLYMLAIWLIEKDGGYDGKNTSRLPGPVVLSHVLLAVTGLVVWVSYLILGKRTLAWAAFFILIAIAILGVTMLGRWIPVYRAPAPVGPSTAQAALNLPAERNFPLFIVLVHGLSGLLTLTIVLLAAMQA